MRQLYNELLRRGKANNSVFLRRKHEQAITYEDADRIATAYAGALQISGVQPGDRVAVQISKSIEGIYLYLACLRLGAAILPLNTAYTAAELSYFLSDAEPALLLCEPSRKNTLASLPEAENTTILSIPSQEFSNLAERDSSVASVDSKASDLAAMLYTSGTTGRPKGAMLTHANLLSNATTLSETWKFSERDILLHALPLYHTHGLFVAINTTMIAGASIQLLSKFDVDDVLQELPRSTVFMGVPTFYTRLLNDPRLTTATIGTMRLFTSGSAPLLAETHHAFEQRTGQRILERYGMTETNMNTSNPYDGERRAGTVGLPLDGVEVRVVDKTSGENVAVGEIGMIEVRGPNVFCGYWKQPEKTAEEFREDGFFITGDLGLIDSLGYVSIIGRGKDLVITGGLNVYPKEVESAIDKINGVTESAVIGLAHSDFGEAVTAVVVSDPASSLNEGEIIAALKDNLAKFKQPKRVILVEELPRNAMGKIQKNLLRERLASLYETT